MYDISFIKRFETTVKKHWNNPALDDYHQSSSTYGELAAKVKADHLLFEAAGLKRR